MFSSWKRRRGGKQPDVKPSTLEPEESHSGGEDGAARAPARGAQDEPRECDSSASTRPTYTPEERTHYVALFAKSDLTASAFCEQHALKYTTFRNWPYKRRAQRASPASKAKRFTPDERRAAVEAFAKSGRKREDFARLWGCSTSSLDKWIRRYEAEGPKGLETRRPAKGRRPHHPKRISNAVRDLIAKIRLENDSFGMTRIADQLERFHGVKVSASTIRNVLREQGIALQPSPKRRPRPKSKPPRRFERARPGELWQSDITSYVLRRQGRRVYLTVFLDDHSRYVVAWALATHQRTPLVTEPLLEGIARFGKPREVLTDQGRQYFAWRGKSGFQKLLAKEGIAHVVSRTHHPETLGKCERLWKTIADEFWDRAAPQDLEDARRRLGHWLRHYNHFRTHQGIDGLVPADRFFDAESTLRQALERELSQNELRLALDETPRKPVYLVGQIGDERIALHGERGRLVIDTPDGGQRELSMQDLGTKQLQEHEDDKPLESAANERIGADPDEAPRAHGPQTLGLSEGAASSVAGARPVGASAQGGEGARAQDVHADAGVLAGEEVEGRDREGAGSESAASLAAEPASAVGHAGGSLDAAASACNQGRLRATDGRVARGAEEAHHDAREGAVAHGGSGARPANSPMAESELGLSREGRVDSCNETQDEDACRSKCVDESDARSARQNRRRQRAWQWLKRLV